MTPTLVWGRGGNKALISRLGQSIFLLSAVKRRFFNNISVILRQARDTQICNEIFFVTKITRKFRQI
jgi:hypothetical protein